jgi:hypothetical protein
LGSKGQVAKPEISLSAPQPETKLDRPIRDAVNDVPRRNLGRSVRVGVETLLVILGLVAVASVIDPKNFLPNAARGLEVAKHNLSQWALLITHQEAAPEKANAEVKFAPKEQRVIVPNGSSIYRIAADAYGAEVALGMDLIKEFNPQIKNLNRVTAGKDLVLPHLTPETLLRQQPDGSYLVVVASFRSQTEANEYAVRLSNKGYQVSITPRKVSDTLLLHRVEINGLKTLDEANQIWQTRLRNEWLAFAGHPDGTR